MTSTGSMVKPGVICCVPLDTHFVEAKIVVSGSWTIAELNRLKKLVLADPHFLPGDYGASTTLGDASGKPTITIAVQFPCGMSGSVQTECLETFVRALSKVRVKVKGFDMSQLAAQPTMH